jgi:hypothetical protein
MHEAVAGALITLDNNPVLVGKKTDSWLNPTFYPVPLSYFYQLSVLQFWDFWVKK